MCGGTMAVCAIEPADLVGQVAAPVRNQEPQPGERIHRAAEHELRDHERLVERIADRVEELVAVHAALGSAAEGMREHEAAELLDGAQHGTILFLCEERAVDRGADLDALEAVLA